MRGPHTHLLLHEGFTMRVPFQQQVLFLTWQYVVAKDGHWLSSWTALWDMPSKFSSNLCHVRLPRKPWILSEHEDIFPSLAGHVCQYYGQFFWELNSRVGVGRL
jgi:hypothetical protein